MTMKLYLEVILKIMINFLPFTIFIGLCFVYGLIIELKGEIKNA